MEHYMNSSHTKELMSFASSEQWMEKTVPEMEHELSILADETASTILENYRRFLPTIPISKPQIVGAELPDGVAAISDRGPIELNINTTLTSHAAATSTTVHEAVHHMQNFVAKYAQERKDKEIDLMRASLGTHKTKAFGIPIDGQIYVNPKPQNISYGTAEEYLRDTMYAMCFIERQARETQYLFMLKHNLYTYDLECFNAEKFDAFREIYNCPKLGDNTIAEIFDAAQLHLCNGTMPQPGTKYASLTASIMYDFAMLTYSQNPTIQERNGPKHDSLRRQLRDPSYKAAKLAAAGYEHSMTYTLDKAQSLTYPYIKTMPQAVRDANPHVMVYAALDEITGKQALELINWESFDKWYFDSDNPMGPKMMDKFAEVAGEKYSYQNRSKAIDEQEIDIQALQPQEDVLNQHTENAITENAIDYQSTQSQQGQTPGSDKR